MELTLLQKIAVWALPVLFAITLHEVAHGWIARMFGDNTADAMGRLTLNPFKHIDPIGTIAVPALMVILPTPYVFGWAKPVPINPQNLRDPKGNMVWVAIAGPLANLAMTLLWTGVALLLSTPLLPVGLLGQQLILMGVAGILINLILMVLNLLPIPPLDGGRIAVGLLPQPASRWVAYLEPFGLPILLLLLFTGGLGFLLGGPFYYLARLFLTLGGVQPEHLQALFN